MRDFKYSMLVTLPFYPMPAFKKSPVLYNDIEVNYGKCEDFFNLKEGWKSGLGETTIKDSFSGERLILIIRSEVGNFENDEAARTHQMGKLSIAYRVIPLLGVVLPHEPHTVLISGDGRQDEEGKYFYDSPRSLLQMPNWIRAGYASKFKKIWDQKIENYKVIDNNGVVVEENVDTYFIWSMLSEGAEKNIFAPNNKYRMLSNAFISFEESTKQNYLEFKFPLQVRAIESLLGLRPGQGKYEFSKRIMKMYYYKDFPFKLHKSIEDIFVDIYQIRSACVHGKEYYEAIESCKSNVGPNENLAYLYEYILEDASIQVFSRFFLRKDLIGFAKDRSSIEMFWSDPRVDSLLGTYN